MQRSRVLVVVGTRPELIKLAPVVRALRKSSSIFDVRVCFTGQHQELLRDVAGYFQIRADCDLGVMQPGQSPLDTLARTLEGLAAEIRSWRPRLLAVQGDTTSAMAGALAGFLAKVEVVHVEAGLRTGDLAAPWPEEFHRRVITVATTLHCAPTPQAAKQLEREGVPASRVRVTGNTVVDALHWAVARERARRAWWTSRHPQWARRRLVLVTAHRRENFGPPLHNICRAILQLARSFPETLFVFPVHPNPHVRSSVQSLLQGHENIHLVPPLRYDEFVWLMDRASLILTDSGGVQEEAPCLGKHVVVLRDTTERPEGVEAGWAELAGTDTQEIVRRATRHLAQPDRNARPPCRAYGDGKAAQRIVQWLAQHLEVAQQADGSARAA